MSLESPSHLPIGKGTLLIASPEIDAGIYFRSVVLLCEHGPAGSFGLIINKTIDVEIPAEVLDLEVIANPHIQIRAGGSLQPSQMMLLHSSKQIPDQTLEICPGVFLGGDVQFLQEATSNASGPHVHLCFGYAGWETDQLEREILSGLWFTYPGSINKIFETAPEKCWQSVLREMGGKYATLSMIPDDLSLN